MALAVLLLSLLLTRIGISTARHGVEGIPPAFDLTDGEPMDTVVSLDAFSTEGTLTGNLVLPCSVTGTPAPTVRWFRIEEDGTETELGAALITGRSNSLVLNVTEGVEATRTGLIYYCLATNMIGPEGSEYEAILRSRDVNVTYTFFDGFESTEPAMEEIATIVGGAVTLECDIGAANPAPTIIWFANTNEFPPAPPNSVLYVDEGRYLFIRVLTDTLRNQQYYCEARGLLLNNTIDRSPITYTLTGEIPTGTLMRYRENLGTSVFKVGDDTLILPYALAAREDDGSIGSAAVTGCTSDDIDENQIMFGNSANLLVTVEDLMPPLENTEVTYTCGILSTQDASSVTGTLILGQRAAITAPAMDAESLIDRERLVGGGSVTYICEVEGIPTPTVTWYHNGGDVPDGVSVNSNQLTIAEPQVSHSGVYQCQATNIIGDTQYEDSRMWILEVRMPEVPDVVSLLRTNPDAVDDRLVGTLIVQPEDTANFAVMVTVTSDPCPMVQWSFEGTDISAGNMYQIDNPCAEEDVQSSYIYTLTITNLNSTTSGEYSAVFSHLGGSTTLPKLFVTVPVPVEVLSLEREVESTGDPQCLLNGSNVTLTCNVVGFPRPTIVFSNNLGDIMPGQAGFERIANISFDQIMISNVNVSDQGTYTCEAEENGLQASQTQTYCTFPDITRSSFMPDNPEVGQQLDFECEVTGIPTPEVEWTKDNVSLPSSDRIFISNPVEGPARVRISRATVDDKGEYRCRATNLAGSDSETFLVQNIIAIGDHPLQGLGTGTVAAIVVVLLVVLVLCFLLILIIMCCWFYNRRKIKSTTSEPPPEPEYEEVQERDGIELETNVCYQQNFRPKLNQGRN